MIFVVCVDRGKQEADIELIKAFVNKGEAESFKDSAEQKLTSMQSHFYYYIEEVELVGGS